MVLQHGQTGLQLASKAKKKQKILKNEPTDQPWRPPKTIKKYVGWFKFFGGKSNIYFRIISTMPISSSLSKGNSHCIK